MAMQMCDIVAAEYSRESTVMQMTVFQLYCRDIFFDPISAERLKEFYLLSVVDKVRLMYTGYRKV